MTVLVKKVFISSKPSIVCLLCPPPCGPFSIQESAVGGLSYELKKSLVKTRLFRRGRGNRTPVNGFGDRRTTAVLFLYLLRLHCLNE